MQRDKRILISKDSKDACRTDDVYDQLDNIVDEPISVRNGMLYVKNNVMNDFMLKLIKKGTCCFLNDFLI